MLAANSIALLMSSKGSRMLAANGQITAVSPKMTMEDNATHLALDHLHHYV